MGVVRWVQWPYGVNAGVKGVRGGGRREIDRDRESCREFVQPMETVSESEVRGVGIILKINKDK